MKKTLLIELVKKRDYITLLKVIEVLDVLNDIWIQKLMEAHALVYGEKPRDTSVDDDDSIYAQYFFNIDYVFNTQDYRHYFTMYMAWLYEICYLWLFNVGVDIHRDQNGIYNAFGKLMYLTDLVLWINQIEVEPKVFSTLLENVTHFKYVRIRNDYAHTLNPVILPNKVELESIHRDLKQIFNHMFPNRIQTINQRLSAIEETLLLMIDQL